MTPTRNGAARLFGAAGIQVYLHWSWFLVAAYEISNRKTDYSSLVWNAFEYVSLFGLVLMHEFGHALACRSVGGKADQIVLWPLGGVAYVAPPPRPGATLWSIAAGPLVNLVLAPVLAGLWFLSSSLGWEGTRPDLHGLIQAIAIINIVLLVFNLLPVYPLDGGQILRALLWFVIGRARSLTVASGLGFVGVAALAGLALYAGSIWIGILAVFLLLQCVKGFQHARMLARVTEGPRHDGLACPSCHKAPVRGAFWVCGRCSEQFDTFAERAVCPRCGTGYDMTQCLECGASRPMREWVESDSYTGGSERMPS